MHSHSFIIILARYVYSVFLCSFYESTNFVLNLIARRGRQIACAASWKCFLREWKKYDLLFKHVFGFWNPPNTTCIYFIPCLMLWKEKLTFQTNKLEAQVHTLQKNPTECNGCTCHNIRSAFKIVFIRHLHCANVICIVFSNVSDQRISS